MMKIIALLRKEGYKGEYEDFQWFGLQRPIDDIICMTLCIMVNCIRLNDASEF